MKNFLTSAVLLLAFVSLFAQKDATAINSQYRVVDSLEIARVPAGFPVHFCLLTANDKQYVAFYDEQRRMTVASRPLSSRTWDYQILPSNVGWDSHNYITMALDSEGQLHLSGNMHVDTLVYFRTRRPGDITSFERRFMTGEEEDRCTYPKFLKDAKGNLVFNYRDGSSGDGVDIYNIYDAKTGVWSRLLDQPLLDGEGERNAYSLGPVRSSDGWFHIAWVWRDTPDCATNHHLSYARSKDLVQWESVFGQKAELPILLEQSFLWVDPIPSGGGIINGSQKLYFGKNNVPVIT